MFAYLQLTLYMTPTHSVPLDLVGEWPGMKTTLLNTFYSTCGAYVSQRNHTLQGYSQTFGRVHGRFFGKQSRASGVKSPESISFSKRNDSVSGSISPASPRLRIRVLDEGRHVHT